MEWQAKQYSQFKKERTLPAIELANAIVCDSVTRALDVGCGIGNSTAVLKKRFPDAAVLGVDSSDDMLQAARTNCPDLEFRKMDVGKEIGSLDAGFDVVFSNACLQWIPDHPQLLPNLMRLLRDGGVLAVQIPQQSKHPMHRVMQKVVSTDAWSKKLCVKRSYVRLTDEEYFDILSQIASEFRMWETTYYVQMPSHQSIVDWYKGTGLQFYQSQLSAADAAAFEADVLAEVKQLYPVQKNGSILFCFPRLFFVARK